MTLSYLHLRPAIFNQLRNELPAVEFALLRACFEARSWSIVGSSTRSKLLPSLLRRRGYGRFVEIAGEFGLVPVICACKNPDLPAQQCFPPYNGPYEAGGKGRQLNLFPASPDILFDSVREMR